MINTLQDHKHIRNYICYIMSKNYLLLAFLKKLQNEKKNVSRVENLNCHFYRILVDFQEITENNITNLPLFTTGQVLMFNKHSWATINLYL